MVRKRIAFAALVAAASSIQLVGAQVGRTVDPAAWSAQPGNIEKGRAVVVGAYSQGPGGACFKCHGIDGMGDGAAAFPRLTDQVYKYLYDSLKDYASGMRQNAVMTPIAQALTEQQMRDVSAYYAAQKAPAGQRSTADPSLLQYGAAIAAVGHAERGVQGCINCHGPDGAGLPPTYPYLAGQYANYLEAQLRGWKTGARKGDGFGIMENIAKRLSDREIRAVSLYYASLRPPSVTPEGAEAGMLAPLPAAPRKPQGR
jgi:cytochrome c553